MKQLIPPDLLRCQAEKPNGAGPFTVGGRPGLVRCTNPPEWIAGELQPGPDGQLGSMSLCSECKAVAERQLSNALVYVEIPRRPPGTGDFSIGSDVWPGLSKLVEESGEVLQIVGKLMGTAGAPIHFDGTNLPHKLQEELADLAAAIDFVVKHCKLDGNMVARRHELKFGVFEQWHRDGQAAKAGG